MCHFYVHIDSVTKLKRCRYYYLQDHGDDSANEEDDEEMQLQRRPSSVGDQVINKASQLNVDLTKVY